MAKGEKQKSKLLYILKILWEESDEKHPLSAKRIVERLQRYDVSCERKTIYTDLEELQAFGFDIIKTGRGTYLGQRQFQLPELQLLVDAVQSSRFITERKSDELIDKLSMLTNRYEGKQLKRQVVVKNRVKTMNEGIYYNVDALQAAMESNCQITFQYWNWNIHKKMVFKRNGEKYRISPWLLLWEDEKYYMVGFEEDSNCMKHFRVDKMLGIEVTVQCRKGRELYEQIDPATYGIENFGMFQGRKETVTLQIDNELAGVIIDRFGYEVWMHPLDEATFTAVVDVMVSNQFFGWVTGFGGKVRIVEPAPVREEYAQFINSCFPHFLTIEEGR